ncbi:MAG: hypothetical protein ABIK86_01505 [candidate division WOR-3 bacterium]
MKTARSSLILSALLLMTLACSVPLLERAEVIPGFSLAAGTGIATGRLTSGYSGVGNIRPPVLDYCLCPIGMFRLSYGMSPRLGLFLQGAAGPGFWLSETDSSAGTPLLYDFRAGPKFRVGDHGAVRAGLGLPGFLDLEYLHDFGRFLTGSAGLGLRGVSLGLCGRLCLSQSVYLVAAGNTVLDWELLLQRHDLMPAASLGFAVEAGPLGQPAAVR